MILDKNSRDFTLSKYAKLCENLKDLGYKFLTFEEYFNSTPSEKIVLMRHDIDNVVDHKICLRMAKIEKDLGVKSTYYTRVIPKVFNLKTLNYIKLQGHEIGYHYEVLNLAKGSRNLALSLFKKQLSFLRQFFNIQTICQHGGLLGNDTASTFQGLLNVLIKRMDENRKIQIYDSRSLWESNDFNELDIIGDAYLSLDYNDFKYFSDTGLAWNNFNSRLLDKVDTDLQVGSNVKTTDNLIEHIKRFKHKKVSILVHPANWIEPLHSWLQWHLLQLFRNGGKRYGVSN